MDIIEWDCGAPYVTSLQTGEWMAYTVNAEAEGARTLEVRAWRRERHPVDRPKRAVAGPDFAPGWGGLDCPAI